MAKNKTVIPFKKDGELYYRIGVRYANKRLFDSSLKYLEKAVATDSFNADYQFNYACVLSELKESKKSNITLLNILKDIDPTLTECYFGIGCNYFDMGSMKKAKEYFEKYLYFDPNGQFADEAYDIIYYLQIYENVGVSKNKNKYLLKLIEEGKGFLKNGEYKKASEKLEKVVEIDPEALEARNDLSVALFCSGEETRAISIAKSVLKLERDNVCANCNLLLFYAASRMIKDYNEQLRAVMRLEANDKENFIKILDTFIKLDDHLNIIRVMINYLKDNTEPAFYHLVAIAFFNLEQYDDSIELWESLKRCYPQYSLLSDHFLNKCSSVKGKTEIDKLEYSVKFPQKEEAYNLYKLNQGLKESDKVYELYKKDNEFKDLLKFYLYEGSADLRKKIIDSVFEAKEPELLLLLRNMVKEVFVCEEIKEYIINTLGIEKAPNNIEDTQDNELKAVTNLKIVQSEWQKEWDAVIDCAVTKSEYSYRSNYKRELKSIWINLVNKNKVKGLPKIKKYEIWAAVIEYIYCSRHFINVSKKTLAEKYNISTSSLINKLKDYEN